MEDINEINGRKSVQLENETLDVIVQKICNSLKIITVDVEKMQRAKDLLASLQRRKMFTRLLGHDEDAGSIASGRDLRMLDSVNVFNVNDMDMNGENEDLEDEELSEDMCLLPFEEDRWHNYFTGFHIMSASQSVEENDNPKCIELSTMRDCDEDLKALLHTGVRCFLLDLFMGPLRDNQGLIVKIREAELSVSKEYGFPVVSTILVKLTPRYQYTGYLRRDLFKDNDEQSIELKKGYKVTLTVDREFSNCCTSWTIFVNARFLLGDVRPFDFILIGEEIQLMVLKVEQDHLSCCVARAGLLSSYMPVLFPSRCSKFRVSYEELEDLTFVREVGLNVVVSNFVGTVSYLDDLENAMSALECDHLRIYARVVLNEIQGCDGELNWATERYDGFLMELAEPALVPDIMHLCPNAECLIQLAHAAKKPIILDPLLINEQKLRIDPAHYFYTFYYPDKYLVKCHQTQKFHYFSFLQAAIYEQITPMALNRMPYCDKSHTGADSLARAIVTASVEVQAVAIVVCGVTTRMVQKISHFRPHVPIIFCSHMRSAEDYVSLYHNVIMLSFRTKHFVSHRRNTFRKAIFSLAYLAARKIAKQNDHVILVYNYEAGTTFPEKYIVYKFDKRRFAEHMCKSMFPMMSQDAALIS